MSIAATTRPMLADVMRYTSIELRIQAARVSCQKDCRPTLRETHRDRQRDARTRLVLGKAL